MPKIYRRKKYYKRKRYIKKKRNRKNTIPRTITSTGIGFPKQIIMTHKYVNTSSFSIPAAAVTMQKFTFSANGMFDPNITSGGHQPLYFDQMSALYNHYTVIGSSYKITIVAPETNLYVASFIEDNDTLVGTSVDAIAEQTQAKKRTFLSSSVKPLIMNLKWSAKKFFGGSILGNGNLQGTPASNPAEQSYFITVVQSDVIPGTGYNLNFTVEVRYIAVWKELKDIASS